MKIVSQFSQSALVMQALLDSFGFLTALNHSTSLQAQVPLSPAPLNNPQAAWIEKYFNLLLFLPQIHSAQMGSIFVWKGGLEE